jgi:hypothetical protein
VFWNCLGGTGWWAQTSSDSILHVVASTFQPYATAFVDWIIAMFGVLQPSKSLHQWCYQYQSNQISGLSNEIAICKAKRIQVDAVNISSPGLFCTVLKIVLGNLFYCIGVAGRGFFDEQSISTIIGIRTEYGRFRDSRA